MHEAKAPMPAEIMATGLTHAQNVSALETKCAMKKAEERRVNSASVLNHEAACIYEACMAKLREGTVEYTERSCTIIVNVPSKTALHVNNGWIDCHYDDEIKTRLAHHFAVENIELRDMTIEDVGCGSMYRSTQITGECHGICCGTSLLFCGIPLLAYWLPMAIYHRIAGVNARHTCKYLVNLSLKKKARF